MIVGGGAAGWLTAGILSAASKSKAIEVVLVESADIPTIGVGEGTWPTMRSTLKKIGLSETDFINSCNVSLKQGSKFVGWRNGLADDVYYHPFTAPTGFTEVDVHAVWQAGFSAMSFGDAVTIQGRICELNKAPKQISTPEYAGVLNYGYHLDAGKFGEVLRKHCRDKLGVRQVVDTVVRVNGESEDDISSIETANNGRLDGDLFVDCSGTHCLLLGEHYGIRFVNKKQESINDRAIAIQVPYAQEHSDIASATIATTQSAGWTWDIGLSSRRGAGYVYSSAHISDNDAEIELKRYVSQSLPAEVANKLPIRKLNIKPGYREKFWHKNCVAVGMAAGFIEPLEASALALVELSANMIRDELPMTRSGMMVVERRFNQVFSYRWQRILEFLKLHYVLSERRDTEYWRDVTTVENVPQGLADLLELWHSRSPQKYDFLHTEELFPFASYQYVLYGMGFKTALIDTELAPESIAMGVENIRRTYASFDKHQSLLPSNRFLIDGLSKCRP